MGFLCCLCNYHVGRHVEINLKLIHMASGVKTHTFGRHVEREIVLMASVGCRLTHVGRHVENS